MSSIKCDQEHMRGELAHTEDESESVEEMTWHTLPAASKSTAGVVLAIARLHFNRGDAFELDEVATKHSQDAELDEAIAQSVWDRWDS